MTNEEIQKGWLESKLEEPKFRRLYERELFAESFFYEIEALMDRKGISRSDLADMLGCNPSNITRIMRRTTNVTAATMVDVAFMLRYRVRAVLEPFAEIGDALERSFWSSKQDWRQALVSPQPPLQNLTSENEIFYVPKPQEPRVQENAYSLSA